MQRQQTLSKAENSGLVIGALIVPPQGAPFSVEGKTKDPDSERMRKRNGVLLKVLQELGHHLSPASHPVPKSDWNCFQFRTGREIPSLASMEQMRRNPSSVILPCP